MTKLSDAVSASNLDSYELARRSNVSEKRLNGYLSGRHSFSRAPLEDAVAIANALGGRIEDYMEDAAEDGEAEKLDDRLRLQLFLDSVDEYELIMKNVGRPQTVTIGGSGEKTEKRYSQLIVEGMLLRKYYSSDEVQLAKVIDSFRRLIPDDASPDVLHTVDLLEKDTPSQGNKSQIVFSNADGSYSSSVDLLFDVLYGITLHGDPDRIQRLARWPITAQCLALYESNVERRKGVVTVRQYIRSCNQRWSFCAGLMSVFEKARGSSLWIELPHALLSELAAAVSRISCYSRSRRAISRRAWLAHRPPLPMSSFNCVALSCW